MCSPVDNSMDKSTNGVKSQSVSKSQNNISRLGQPWDNGGTNLLSIGMNDDSKQKAQGAVSGDFSNPFVLLGKTPIAQRLI